MEKTSSSDDEYEEQNNKYLHVAESVIARKPMIQCSLAPHSGPLSFYNLEDYEVHYAKDHSNRCSECHKNFPSNHFLQLHLAENHDPIQDARKARGEKTVRCWPCISVGVRADTPYSTTALSRIAIKSAPRLSSVDYIL